MRDFGILKGADLVPVLNTLLQEGALASTRQVTVLKAVHQELQAYIELFFLANRCIHVASSDNHFHLEQFLLRKQILERSQIDAVHYLLKSQTDTSLSQLLQEKQWANRNELISASQHLAEMAAYEILLWKETSFELANSQARLQDYWGTGLPTDQMLSIQGLVADADKNLPVLILMKEKLANPQTILRRTKELEASQLSEHQQHIYRHINNRTSIREVLLLSDLTYFETFTTLFQLLSWDYIALGQLDTPAFARSRQETIAESRPKTESRSVPRPVINKKSAVSTQVELPAVTPSGPRQFLRRGRGSELLQVLVSVMKSGYAEGKVIVDHQQQILRAEFSLLKGSVVHVSTTAFNMRFGDLLVHRGILGPGQLREALEEQKENPDSHLGAILIEQGFIAEDTIPQLVLHQMEAAIYEVLTWADVKFYFDPQAKATQEEIYQKVSIGAPFEILEGRLNRTDQSNDRNLLEEADRNLPILLTMRAAIPSLKLIPHVHQETNGSLSPEQSTILAAVDGKSTLQEILLGSSLNYFAAYTALYQLITTAVITLSETTIEKRPLNLASRPVTLLKKTISDNLPSHTETLDIALEAVDLSAPVFAEPLIDPELQSLFEQVPTERYAQLRQAIKTIVQLSLQTDAV